MPRIPRRSSFVQPFLILSLFLLLMSLPGGHTSIWNKLRPTVSASVASTFTVNSTGDGADSNLGDGACNDGTGACTLRAAIQQSNAAVSADVINFNVPANSTINLNTNLGSIGDDLNINGPGANTLTVKRNTAAGTPSFIIFSILPNKNVSINGLTISNGNYSGIFNEGSLVISNCIIDGNRHGVINRTELVINDSVISNSTESGFQNEGQPGTTPTATINRSTISGNLLGGVFNQAGFASSVATLTVNNSTFSTNNFGDGSGGGITTGGIQGGTAITFINNSTISGNRALLGPGFAGGVTALGWGSGSSGTVSISNSTITANDAPSLNSGAAGMIIDTVNGGAAAITLHNTIVAGNYRLGGTIPSDITGTVNPVSSFNLIGAGGSGGLSNGVNNNQVGVVNPGLGPLGNNGGPTFTHALLQGSPAIDSANSALVTDQRGQPRPVDDSTVANAAGSNTSDIGAYEAHTLEVNNTADEDSGGCTAVGIGNGCTLREAVIVANAQPGSELITFAPALTAGGVPNSIHLLTALPDLSSDMMIRGPGINLLTVDRLNSGGVPEFRIFNVLAGNTVELTGFVIFGGRLTGASGAGISNAGTLTINDCFVFDNRTNTGAGGIYNAGTLTVNNSTITFNVGGGIQNDVFGANPTATINNSNISSNTVGGGIHNNGFNGTATLTVNSCTISGNSSTSFGGGISNSSGAFTSRGIATINNSTISGNSSASGGGGVMNGAFFGFAATTLTINNSTISGNSDLGSTGGGGVYHITNGSGSAASLTINNGTIAGNNATSSANGGGILIKEDAGTTNSVTLRSTIVAGNSRNLGTIRSDIFGKLDAASSFNLIGDGTGMTGATDGSSGNQVGSSLAPIDPRLGILANNGGPTFTRALQEGSRAIDAGNSSLTTDQRGESRPFDLPGVVNAAGSDASDIGAYEVGHFVVNTTADTSDGACAALGTGDGCSLREAIAAANLGSGAAAITFEPGLTSGGPATITLLTALPELSSSITIAGPGASLLTVRRSFAVGTPAFRIFKINSGKTVTISGLTITNGKTTGNFPDNSGAGIWNDRGTLTVRDSVITGNAATLTNPVGFGGGIYNDGSSGGSAVLTIIRSTISGNSVGGNGGGIFSNGFQGIAGVTILGSTISGNSASAGGGGGIHSDTQFGNGFVRILNSTISGNNAQSGGGVSNVGNDAQLTILNSTISGNGATVIGGGLVNQSTGGAGGAPVTITNSTITNNRSDTDNTSPSFTAGGGMFIFSGNVILRNTIVSANFNGGAGAIPDNIANAGVDTANSSFNLIGSGGSGGLINGVNSNQVGVDNPGLGSLTANGGPTETHALLAGSPALDSGSNANVPVDTFDVDQDGNTTEIVSTDQRSAGFSRIIDGPDADTTGTVDIGAFEAQIWLANSVDQTINEDGALVLFFNLGDPILISSVTATSSNAALVPNDPANISIDGSGSTLRLLINPAANAFGASTITITVNGSNGQTMMDTFVLTVNSVNDAPSFTKGSDQTVNENDGAQTITNWATSISAGPNESGQPVNFVISSNSNPGLFAVAPAVSPAGTLTYTPAAGASGSALITIALMDNGGTANGGSNTSAAQSFNINVREGGALQFSASAFAVTEDGANAVITVTRTGGAAGEARVNYATSNGTATTGQDYTAVSGTLTFADGVTSQSFNVAITNDAIDEPDETIDLTLTSPAGSGSLGTPVSAVLTITDNDPAPSISIDDLSVTEGNSGTVNAIFTVTLSGQSTQTVTVDFATAAGTATAGSDYQTSSGTLTFLPLETTKPIIVTVNGDTNTEANETFLVNLSTPVNATISDGQGGGTITNDDVAGGFISFSQANYTVAESGGFTTITVTRSNDLSAAVTVDYATAEDSTVVPCATANSIASSRCDFTTAVGTLRFAAGESSQTFLVLISQDNYVEGPETVAITLSNPTGGAALATPSTATLTITDDATEPATNPIDTADAFVRQHYHDFLNREPDAPGLAFWSNQITECQQPGATCSAEVRRINVSAAFFLSIEFQETGYLVYRTYKSAYGNISGTPVPLRLNEFLPDTQQIGKGVQVGVGNWEALLEANKVAFALDFVSRVRFTSAYPTTLTPAEFVDALFAHGGVTPSAADRDAAIAEFGGAGNTADTAARARALRRVAENETLKQQEFNRAFVLMQYFGYLRRNPNDAPEANLDFGGYNFWLGKLNEFNGNFVNAEMVKAFLVSGEYRQRFGP